MDSDVSRAGRSSSRWLMRNGFFNASGWVIAGLAGLVTVPVFLNRLGAEGYALIVSTAAAAALPSCLETGLSLSVTREVAANKHDADFLSSAAMAYAIFAGITFVVAFISVLGFSSALHVSSVNCHPLEFAISLFAFAFASERGLDFSIATLAGLGRFDISSLLSAGLIVIRSAVSIVVLWAWGSLIGVALSYAACSITIMLCGILISCALAKVRLRFELCNWKRLRPSLSFGAAVTGTVLLQDVINDGRMLLTGILSGWTGMAVLSAAQKFPQAVSGASWRAAETLVPVTVGIDDDDLESSSKLFRHGSHHVLMLVFPACIILFVTAPTLVRLWLGSVMPNVASVLRWTSAAVIVDAIGLAAIQILWGRGHARFLLWLHVCSSLVCMAITVLSVPRIGISGAAIAVVGSSLVASAGALGGVQRLCRIHVTKAFGGALAGLAVPVVGLACITIVFSKWLSPEYGRAGYISLLAVNASVYLALLLLFGEYEDGRTKVLRGRLFAWYR